ncbi:MAG TPA: glutathione peroxidase, partial [Candidatus Elarobacter sp.]
APYRGKVLLIVNVASKCSFTPQYAGLEALYREFQARGLVVLGFPCNQFLAQEPGTEADVKQFCATRYNVSFPLFAKVDVNGPNAHPLYRYLKEHRPGTLGTGAVKWNFTKFLVDRDGKVVKRYGMFATPRRIGRDLVRLGLVPDAVTPR